MRVAHVLMYIHTLLLVKYFEILCFTNEASSSEILEI